MHQSRIFSSQLMYVFVKRSGTNLMRPSFTASMAGFARSSIFTNHCLDTSGSIVEWQREQ